MFKSLGTLMVLVFTVILFTACPATNQSVLTPIQQAGCDVETGISNAAGNAIAGLTGAPNPAACGAALQVGLGNANFCAVSLPTAVAAAPQLASDAKPKYSKIGDIPSSALKGGSSARKADDAILGAIGQIVCPVGDSAVVGLLSGAIPPACQGPNSITASAANQAIITACEALLGGI